MASKAPLRSPHQQWQLMILWCSTLLTTSSSRSSSGVQQRAKLLRRSFKQLQVHFYMNAPELSPVLEEKRQQRAKSVLNFGQNAP
jgi:hypothetical protein